MTDDEERKTLRGLIDRMQVSTKCVSEIARQISELAVCPGVTQGDISGLHNQAQIHEEEFDDAFAQCRKLVSADG